MITIEETLKQIAENKKSLLERTKKSLSYNFDNGIVSALETGEDAITTFILKVDNDETIISELEEEYRI